MAEIYAGLVTGTSLDGVSCGLFDFAARPPRPLAHIDYPLPEGLRRGLLELSTASAPAVALVDLGRLDAWLGEVYADAAQALCVAAGVEACMVEAFGLSGQTVLHRPADHPGHTLQIGDPSRLVGRLHRPVVSDFRRADVASGGQGAPLAPLFHRYAFAQAGRRVGVLNLGGIANLTVLPGDPTQAVIGFDTGPANSLLDLLVQQHTAAHCDRDGELAAQGQVWPALLERWLADPYYAAPAPKSTGRDRYGRDWLAAELPAGLPLADAAATLVALSAQTVADAVHGHEVEELLLCGGGARNPALVRAITIRVGSARVQSTDALGLPSATVEAGLFAFLARERLASRELDLRTITGSSRIQRLGAIWE